MAGNVRKKKTKRSMNLVGFSFTLLLISSLLFFCSSLFLRTYNNSLSTKKQAIDLQIAALESQNKDAELDIRSLASKSRIDEVAANEGLQYNQENITTISLAKTDGE